MTVWDRIPELLADGRWHAQEHLARVSAFPEEWVRELELAGEAEVGRDTHGQQVVRLVGG